MLRKFYIKHYFGEHIFQYICVYTEGFFERQNWLLDFYLKMEDQDAKFSLQIYICLLFIYDLQGLHKVM